MKLDLDEAREILRTARKVAVLTGAGISAESGIPVFRGPDGLWNENEIQRVATIPGFLSDPEYAWTFHLDLMKKIHQAEPSRAHYLLAKLENYYPEFHVITQNVDNLHQNAGNRKVVELHGNIWYVKCLKEERSFPVKRNSLENFKTRCSCGGVLKPDVVFFGEALPKEALHTALKVSAEAELMLVIGTSAVVQPAASLPYITRENGGMVFEFNPNPTCLTRFTDFSLQDNASTGLELAYQWFLEDLD